MRGNWDRPGYLSPGKDFTQPESETPKVSGIADTVAEWRLARPVGF